MVKDRKELNTLKVEHQLYKNCSKYGFIYKNNMDKFLMNFTGEVYIAKTVYLNFEEEMKKLFGAKVYILFRIWEERIRRGKVVWYFYKSDKHS